MTVENIITQSKMTCQGLFKKKLVKFYKRSKKLDAIEIGIKLKEARQEARLSQNAVAKITGIEQSLIGKYENGKTIPSIIACMKLAKAYEVTLDELFNRDIGGG